MKGNSVEAEREHALRNAVNVIDFSLLLAGKAIENGEGDRAMEFLARARGACAQCRALMAEQAGRGGAPP
jgi:hypothetical protein